MKENRKGGTHGGSSKPFHPTIRVQSTLEKDKAVVTSCLAVGYYPLFALGKGLAR